MAMKIVIFVALAVCVAIVALMVNEIERINGDKNG